MRTVMVIAQVAMSMVLLIGCGLLTRSMVKLTSVNLGFDTENIIGATYEIQSSDHPSPHERAGLFASLIEEIEALPGVTSAAAISKLPLASRGTDWPIWHASQPRPEPLDSNMALARFVTPGYFDTIGIPVLRGRDFTDADTPDTAPALVVSEAIASALFADQNPLGQMVKLGWMDQTFEIVGVVGNAKINGARSTFDEAMYLSSAQFGIMYQWLVVRSNGDPAVVAASFRRLVEAKDRNAVLGDFVTFEALVDRDLKGFKAVTLALVLLSGVALLLTAVGLYGVLAYHSSQRTNEFGIRFALGASPTEVIGLILRQGLVMVGGGLILGLIAAFASSRITERLLYEVEPLDPGVFTGAALFFGTVALIACLVPALRAARVNPVTALRRE